MSIDDFAVVKTFQGNVSQDDYNKLFYYADKLQNEKNRITELLDKRKTEIEQIDNCLKAAFGFTHREYSIDDFTEVLKSVKKQEKNKFDLDESTDALDAVEKLIRARKMEYNIPFSEEVEIEVVRFDVKQLREIADYLTVYCNARENM